MYNYKIFKELINSFINQMEESIDSSDKKVLDALKSFLETIDSLDKLSEEERNKFLNLFFTALTGASIK